MFLGLKFSSRRFPRMKHLFTSGLFFQLVAALALGAVMAEPEAKADADAGLYYGGYYGHPYGYGLGYARN